MQLDIPKDMEPWVMNAIARSAKQFDNMINANGYGNLSATEKDVFEWQEMSDKLWALVRQFSGGEKTIEEPLRIVVK